MARKAATKRKAQSITRESKQRAIKVVRPAKTKMWTRDASLEMPKARPGMDQRWIRFQFADGKPDTTNYSRKCREGWHPVDPKNVSKDFHSITVTSGKLTGLIVDGMILCERPIEISIERKEYIDSVTEMRTEALDHDLEQTNRSTRGQAAFGPVKKQQSRKLVYERKVPVKEDAQEEL